MAIGATLGTLGGIGAATAAGIHLNKQSKLDYDDKSRLGKMLDPGISQGDVKEAFMPYVDELKTAQEQDPQGLSGAQFEQGMGAATTAAEKTIAAQQAALEGSVADQTTQSLKRQQMILEEGGDAIAETTAQTSAGLMGLSEEIEAQDAERIAAEEQRLLANIMAYRQSRGNFLQKVFGAVGGAMDVSGAIDTSAVV
tara:strand:+ start:131 stop:721 length:591 start_codon:yes stop_codon:yes gene_type:complete